MARPRRRRTVSFLAVVAPAFLSAGLLVASAVPAQAIDVAANSQSPVPGEEEVATNTNVRVTFDVPARGVNANTFTLTRIGRTTSVPAVVTADATSTTFTLDPNANLDGGTSYTARLSNTITDEGAVAFAGASWEFTTIGTPAGAAPTVIDRMPGIGAAGVSLREPVSVTFSEPVQGVDETSFTLTRGGVSVPALVVQRRTADRWSLIPDDPLLDNTLYTVRLHGGPAAIRDLADVPLADTSWSFRTGAGADTVAPRLLLRFPGPGDTGVNRLTDVRVRFSEAVLGVDIDTFTLTNTRNGDDVLATVSRLGGSRQWVLEPDRALRRGTRYVARLSGGAAGIQDVSGNALRSTTWSFRTRF